MFGFGRKNKVATIGGRKPGDPARVELIRERLSDHVSTGEKTNFDIAPPATVDDDGTYEFTVTNIARVNYDVTEWNDMTEADTDVRRAFEAFEEDSTDYWSRR